MHIYIYIKCNFNYNENVNSELKELRLKNKFTQAEAASFLNVSLRSYKDYETNVNKVGSIKYNYMISRLAENCLIDEERGILTIQDIKDTVSMVLADYNVDYCYLFGSYAKGNAKENSDVDLLISTDTHGLKFYGLVERLRNELHKKIDLLNVNQLKNNIDLIDEILKEGIKIYG